MRLVPALPKWPGGDRKPHACAHPAQGQKDERTRQRDGGGPATEAETNGAPGERDRQEILLNQDTALKHYCCYYYYLHVREKAGVRIQRRRGPLPRASRRCSGRCWQPF